MILVLTYHKVLPLSEGRVEFYSVYVKQL